MTKKTLINFKADPDEAARWKAAAEKDKRTISDVCRAALELFTRHIEKRGDGGE